MPDAPAQATATGPVAVGEREWWGAVRPAVAEAGRKTPNLAPPIGLRLPSLGLSVRIVPVTVDRDGVLEVPANPDTLGWWRFGARPGQAQGSVVIDGHVDSATKGLGAFARLRELEPGALVLTESAAGDLRRYRVTGRRQFPKAALPVKTIFSQNVQERLVLITCGGQFNEDEGSYEDNIVVFAVPQGA